MKIIHPSHEILFHPDCSLFLNHIEIAGRTCYKSEDRITNESSVKFVNRILTAGHHSVIEHLSVSVRIVCDRGVSHELVRHRLASYSQESTRYANYSKDKFGNEITVIKPLFWDTDSEEYKLWHKAMKNCEDHYLTLISMGASPEKARSVLPNSLKTEVVMTCNLREWRHVFNLRCSPAAHPQMRQIMLPLLRDFKTNIPIIYDDIFSKYENDMLMFSTDVAEESLSS